MTVRPAWVMFDYGGVISYPPARPDLARLAAAAGAAPGPFMDAYLRWRRGYDLDELNARGYWRQVGLSLGRDYGDALVAELTALDRAAWLRVRAGTTALIGELAAAGWPLALLSNAPGDLAGAVRGLPVAALFRHLIFSCDLRSAKPDREIYDAALARLGAPAGEVIFVDDDEENVAAAAALGLRAMRFTSPARVRAAITGLLTTVG